MWEQIDRFISSDENIINTTSKMKVDGGYIYKDAVRVFSIEGGTLTTSIVFVPERKLDPRDPQDAAEIDRRNSVQT